MQEAGYGLTEAAFGGVDARNAGDSALLVRFFNTPVEDKEASEEAGRPIFKEQVFIEIKTPGASSSTLVRKARQMDKERFHEHWRLFEARTSDDEILVGTPLEEWPGITRTKVEELKFFNIRTVEQLAEMSDTAGQNFMGIQPLRAKAKEFLAKANSNEELAKQLKAANERLVALEAAADEAPKRRGRKPKIVEE